MFLPDLGSLALCPPTPPVLSSSPELGERGKPWAPVGGFPKSPLRSIHRLSCPGRTRELAAGGRAPGPKARASGAADQNGRLGWNVPGLVRSEIRETTGGSGCPCLLRLGNPQALSLGLDFLPAHLSSCLSMPPTPLRQPPKARVQRGSSAGGRGGHPHLPPTSLWSCWLLLLFDSRKAAPRISFPLPPSFKWPGSCRHLSQVPGAFFYFKWPSLCCLQNTCLVKDLFHLTTAIGQGWGGSHLWS